MRVAYISDTHKCSGFEARSLFARKLQLMNRSEALRLYERLAVRFDEAISASTEWLSKNGPWDRIFHLGDVVDGWQERGCYHAAAQRDLRHVIGQLEQLAPVRAVPGNHDLGYQNRSSFVKSGALQPASVEVWRERVGELFWSEKLGEKLFIGLSSCLASYGGRESALLKLKTEQSDFLRDALNAHNGPWELHIHNVLALRHLIPQLSGQSDRLTRVICGDFHHPVLGRVLPNVSALIPRSKFISHQAGRVMTEYMRKSTLCPSVAPLFWRGFGILVACEAEKLEQIDVSSGVCKPVPSSSALNCLLWSFLPRFSNTFNI